MMCRFGQFLILSLGLITLILIDESEAILGGHLASPEQFPYYVAIGNPAQSCGGGILDDYHILTAAHCFFTEDDEIDAESPYSVTAGAIDLNDDRRIVIPVGEIFIPYDYEPMRVHADIAVVKLRSPLNIREKPKLLSKLSYPRDLDYVNERPIVTGCGWDTIGKVSPADLARDNEIGEGGIAYDDSGLLKYARTLVVSHKACQKKYSSRSIKNFFRRKKHLRVTDDHLCASVENDTKEPAGACHGDSGGPLVLNGNIVLGVVTMGSETCDDSKAPTVYTKVFPFIGFIEKVLRNERDPRTRIVGDKHAVFYYFGY